LAQARSVKRPTAFSHTPNGSPHSKSCRGRRLGIRTRPAGPLTPVRPSLTVHRDPTATWLFCSNKTQQRVQRNPRVRISSLALFSHTPHRNTPSGGRPSNEWRTMVPPWTPSPVPAPTDGWTRHRQAAPRWGPTHTRLHESRSGDGSSSCGDHGELEHRRSSLFLSTQW
jgi:hypothetical protein